MIERTWEGVLEAHRERIAMLQAIVDGQTARGEMDVAEFNSRSLQSAIDALPYIEGKVLGARDPSPCEPKENTP